MGAPSTPEMHDLLDKFLHGEIVKDQSELAQAVKVLLKAEPEYAKPSSIIPTEEIEIRRDYAVQIQKKILKAYPGFKLTPVHLATIMTTPLHNLQRDGHLSYRDNTVLELANKMNLVVPLVKRYLRQKFQPDEPHAPTLVDSPRRTASASKKRTRSVSHKPSSRKVRSAKQSEDPDADYFPPDDGGEAEKKLCRERDRYRCIFMQTAQGDVAHIIPRSWNDTAENMELTRQVFPAARAFMDKNDVVEYETLFADTNNLATSDKSWNMLYLNKQLHWYLDHVSVGFKCLGIDPHADDDTKATVNIQLHWLHRTKINPIDKVTLEGDDNDFDKMIVGIRQYENERGLAYIEPGEGMFAAVRANNHVPLISGHYVRINMATEDAKKCKVMLDLAWSLGVVAAMSGAADWPNLLPDHEDWDDIQQKAAVQRWVQDQARHLPVDLPSQAPARPPRGLNFPLQAPELPPRSPERMPRSPRTPDRTVWPIGRPPAERSQSPTPLGTITNRPRLDTSPEKSKLLGTPIALRTQSSTRREESPEKGSEKLQQHAPGSPRILLEAEEPLQENSPHK
ncbi:hypothetical protein FLAG1_05019 [Fusarium langsethiae]|uniref:Uncharacterized protein n=1 Tax=Fusarium langsethiae TaxID=179993 RepID=A0A0M9EY01_FUSLA|nr:hypothetical protein FLAG1_05019 [Fusarium langsethiae]GKU03040.1 unnamed protein product [Fusarium langsethiae]